ncbi:MAG: ribonucleotide reductase N-terminal alpha domain-containing protein, partial [Chloroflexota bacterium]
MAIVSSSVKAGVWSEPARKVLAERYLWKKDGRLIEDEDGMCRRVAAAVAKAEEKYASAEVRAEVEDRFFHLMVERKFMPNSPTLMNAGKANGQQLSACFVLPVPDSIDGIFDSVKHAAIIHKSGGGTGFA